MSDSTLNEDELDLLHRSILEAGRLFDRGEISESETIDMMQSAIAIALAGPAVRSVLQGFLGDDYEQGVSEILGTNYPPDRLGVDGDEGGDEA